MTLTRSKKKPSTGNKTAPCKECGEKMQIAVEVAKGTCWKCVCRSLSGPNTKIN